jgi:ferritin
MLSDRLLEDLNEQMNSEFFASHLYLAMGSYCLAENWDGFANFFIVQSEEERFHAMKIFRFINTLGKRAIVKDLAKPNNEYTSILNTFEQAFEHEKKVTRQIYQLSDKALDEREHATIHFLKWFIDEQVEEEATFDTVIQKLKRIENDSNSLFMLDAEFGNRTFVAE